jgi:hypothetical protein
MDRLRYRIPRYKRAWPTLPDDGYLAVGEPDKASQVVATVLGRGEDDGRYKMFEVGSISPEEAFLPGDLVLEVDDVIDLELAFPDGETIRVTAIVERAVLALEAGISVRFHMVEEVVANSLRAKLAALG